MKESISALAVGLFLFSLTGFSWAEERVGDKKIHDSALLNVSSITTTQTTATLLAQELVAPGIPVSNVIFKGNLSAAGIFSNAASSIGLSGGVVLSTGNAADVVGPNANGGTSTAFGTAGYAGLDALLGGGAVTRDAAVLEFDFIPSSNFIEFDFVFSSEEYNEFVGSNFNDVFGFFVNHTNCALVNGSPISINNINNNVNPQLYRDNTAGGLDTEMDGLTTVLTCKAAVNPGVVNHIDLAIADVTDAAYDSAVFILAKQIGVVAVPTLSVWGKLALISSLLIFGLIFIRRRA